jgi:putative CocE/NonD family hydrolase
VQLYLNADGVLSANHIPAASSGISIPVNPFEPVPSICGGNLTTKAGICDQSSIDARPDVAVFQTAPVEKDTFIEGDVTVRLRASFSSDDGDVVVRLSQVTPNGGAMLLSDGIVRARFMNGCESFEGSAAGGTVDFDVKLSPVAFELPVGHALRIAVSGTSSPRYEVNPGYLVPLSENPELLQTELGVVTDYSYVTVRVSNRASWDTLPDTSDDVVPDTAEVQDSADMPDVADTSAEAGFDEGPGVDVIVAGDVCSADSLPCECPAVSGCQAMQGAGSNAGVAAFFCLMLALIAIIAVRRRSDSSHHSV